MRRLLIPLLILLYCSSLSAQTATRLGVAEGMGFTGITYNFYGREHDRTMESMAYIGLMVEVPVAENMLLSVRAALTTLNGTAGLASRVHEESGSSYYRSSIKEQWILETPVLAKYMFAGKELRPYVGLGGFLDINASPAEIRVTKDSDASWSASTAFPALNGGVIACFGVDIKAASMLLISPEFAVRQLLSPPIDTEILTQNNNPRFLFSIAILFTLDHERWK